MSQTSLSQSYATDTQFDTKLRCRWMLSMDTKRTHPVEEFQSILIKDGRIGAIVATAEDDDFKAAEVVELDQHIVLPGYINAHGHAAMSLFRGMADDLPLMTWLEQHIWPAEGQWVNPEFVYHGTELAIAEMLKSGTTTFADMYFFTDDSLRAASDAGMRAVGFTPVLDFPTNYAANADGYIDKALLTLEKFQNNPLITVGFGPHAPYTVSDAPLKRLTELVAQLQAPMQIHLHETAFEVHQSEEQFSVRPTRRLADLGFLTSQVSCVHMTQINDEDVAILRETGASVVHCPESNLKLASGFCPVQKLLDNNVTVALGTDGAASNNDLNLQGEMKTAAMLAKAVAGDASAFSAYSALKSATIGGAEALGIAQQAGSISTGKWADIQAVKVSELEQQPLYDAASQLVYTDSSRALDSVWVGGQRKVRNGKLVSMDEQKIIATARQWRDKIATK